MPVLLSANEPTIPKMSRLGCYPIGALRLSQYATDLGCAGLMSFRGGRPFMIGAHSPLTPTNAPGTAITEEGLAYDLVGASAQSASATVAARQIGSTLLSIVARFKPRVLPSVIGIAGAATWGNSVNGRGVGVGVNSSGQVIAYGIGSTSTVPTPPGTNVWTNSFVTVGASAVATSGARLYENGVFISSAGGGGSAGSANAGRLRIGDPSATVFDPFDGQILWAAIFNQVLGDRAQAAIAAHPEKLLALKYPQLTGSVVSGGGGGGGTVYVPTMPLLGVITSLDEHRRRRTPRRWHQAEVFGDCEPVRRLTTAGAAR